MFLLLKIFDNKKENKVEKKKTAKKVEEKVKEKIGESPIIKLNGPESYKVVKNGAIYELGATATDKEDGDLSKEIKIEDKVKYDTPGEYEIVYSVKDKDENESKVSRKITIFEVEDKDDDGIAVLMYHYFYDDTAGERNDNPNYMAKSLLEEQLKYLNENDYYIPTMKELSLYLDGKLDLPKKSVVLTLDDGNISNYTLAYPLAVQYKIPLVMFVVTSWTDVSQELQSSMRNSGYIRFHSHTDNMHDGGCGEQHGAKILCIDHDAGVNDLKTSIEKIGNADALAYPCGDINENGLSIVREAGFSMAFTVEYGLAKRGLNKLTLPRVRLNDGVSLNTFINSL